MKHLNKIPQWFLIIVILVATGTPLVDGQLNNTALSRASAQTPTYEPRFEPDFCPVRLTFDFPLKCGYLIVPEDRQNPDGKQIRLAVAIVESRAENPAPDPILLVQGDLGMDAIGAGLPLVDRHYGHWLNDRDFMIMDQRGSGFSEPALNCPEMELMYYERVGLQLSSEDDTALANAAMQRCYDRHSIDASFYNSAQSAMDIRDLRIALGLDEWNLFGFSGATRTVLNVVRDYPEGIRSVILDAVMPTDIVPAVEGSPVENGIFKLIDACNADPACAEAHPDLINEMVQVVDKLNENPVIVPIWHMLEEDTTEFYLDGNIAISRLVHFIGGTGNTGLVPLMLNQLLNEEYVAFVGLVSQNLAVNLLFAEGAFISSYCYSVTSIPEEVEPVLILEQDLPEELTTAIVAGERSILSENLCDIWTTTEASDNYYAPVESDIPALMLTGSFDLLSPPEWGRHAATGLTNGIFIEVPGLGHGTLKNDCPITIASQFIADPTGGLDTTCLDAMSAFDYRTAISE